jgi:PHP family Zn ribbon phosphoesterase
MVWVNYNNICLLDITMIKTVISFALGVGVGAIVVSTMWNRSLNKQKTEIENLLTKTSTENTATLDAADAALSSTR